MQTIPFDWYSLNLADLQNWLGSVIQHLYYIWVALWTPLHQLPGVGINDWPQWITNIWNMIFSDWNSSGLQANWLGERTLIEFALGSYLLITIALVIVRFIRSVYKT